MSNSLSIINNKSEDINEKYDKQEKALQTISEINQEISEIQKGRLTIADALTKGDVSAAAAAVQEMQAASAKEQVNLKTNF